MLVIRLQRTGRRNAPTYRIVVAENSAPIQGKFVEIVGHYLPTRTPIELEFKQDRIEHWVGNGAKPTDTVARLLSKSGVKGLETYIKAYTKQKKKNTPEEEETPAQAPAAAAEEKTEEPPAEEVKEEAPAEEVKEESVEAASPEPEATEEEKAPEEDKKEEETDATEAEVDKEEEGDNEEKSS